MARLASHAFLLLLTAAFLSMGTTPARAIPLSDLLEADHPGMFIDSDGLRFSNFQYSSTGDMPDADMVNVLPTMDAFGNYGLRFQAAFLDMPHPGPQRASDAGLSFKVEVIEGALITDAHLYGDPNVIADLTGFVTVTETIDAQHQMEIFAFGNPELGSQFADWVYFEPTSELNLVVKDILAFTRRGVATISVIEQTFSREEFPPVPEPGTMLLLGFGLAGLAVTGRKRS